MKNKLKRSLVYFLFVAMATVLTTQMSSCKAGHGCPAEEHYEKTKDQPLSNKKGKSNLFSKKQRKKMKSRNK